MTERQRKASSSCAVSSLTISLTSRGRTLSRCIQVPPFPGEDLFPGSNWVWMTAEDVLAVHTVSAAAQLVPPFDYYRTHVGVRSISRRAMVMPFRVSISE